MQNQMMITPNGQALHTTRRSVLEALRSAGTATVAQLAEMVGVKGITIRHHLNALLAEGLVDAEEKRQAVGRPIYMYRLTTEAENLFPQKYHQLVERLLLRRLCLSSFRGFPVLLEEHARADEALDACASALVAVVLR